jgi:hypothetical protein
MWVVVLAALLLWTGTSQERRTISDEP